MSGLKEMIRAQRAIKESLEEQRVQSEKDSLASLKEGNPHEVAEKKASSVGTDVRFRPGAGKKASTKSAETVPEKKGNAAKTKVRFRPGIAGSKAVQGPESVQEKKPKSPGVRTKFRPKSGGSMASTKSAETVPEKKGNAAKTKVRFRPSLPSGSVKRGPESVSERVAKSGRFSESRRRPVKESAVGEKNTAEKISAVFGDNGNRFEVNGKYIEDYCEEAGGVREVCAEDKDVEKYVFPDKSVITITGYGWDLGYQDCFCWRGAGHNRFTGCNSLEESRRRSPLREAVSGGVVVSGSTGIPQQGAKGKSSGRVYGVSLNGMSLMATTDDPQRAMKVAQGVASKSKKEISFWDGDKGVFVDSLEDLKESRRRPLREGHPHDAESIANYEDVRKRLQDNFPECSAATIEAMVELAITEDETEDELVAARAANRARNSSALRNSLESRRRPLRESFQYEGTVSEATHRPQDLIPSFIEVLKDLDPEKAGKLEKEIPSDIEDEDEWWDSEEADFVLSDLFDALGEVAPEGYYFGAHEGDGSDFGFWKYDEEIFEESRRRPARFPQRTPRRRSPLRESAEEAKVASGMQKKGYKYFLKLKGEDRNFYFKTAGEIGPFLREEYPDAVAEDQGPVSKLFKESRRRSSVKEGIRRMVEAPEDEEEDDFEAGVGDLPEDLGFEDTPEELPPTATEDDEDEEGEEGTLPTLEAPEDSPREWNPGDKALFDYGEGPTQVEVAEGNEQRPYKKEGALWGDEQIPRTYYLVKFEDSESGETVEFYAASFLLK